MKKLFLLTCALVAMAASSMAYDYDWASANGAGAIYYKLNSPKAGEATVVAGEWEYRDNVEIPSEITVGGNTYRVTTIGANAFYYCYDVISVTLGKNVTTIETGAFTRSSGPSRTVYDENQKKNVTISGIMINIDSDALTTIKSNAFSVTTLAPNKGVDTLAIGKNVAGLSDRSTFFNWVTFSNVKHYYVDPSSTTLSVDEDGVLYNKSKTKLYLHPQQYLHKTFEIPSTVQIVANMAFYGMNNGSIVEGANGKPDTLYLRDITGGENVQQMGSTISGTYLRTLPIGKHVTTMSDGAMNYVSQYFLPTVHAENSKFKLIDSVLYRIATPDTILCQYFKIRKNPVFVVPSFVTQIVSLAFYSVNINLDYIDYINCTKSKLRSIAGDAFLSTKNSLKFLHEENVFDVDEYGVIYTDKYESVRLYASDVSTETYNMPEATTSLPRNVIKTNGFVKNFNINKNCTTINTEHLDEMENLQYYHVNPDNSKYYSDESGVLYEKTGNPKKPTILRSYPRGNDRLFYKVVDGTKQIGVRAFYRNKNLVGLDLGDDITSVVDGNSSNMANMQKLNFIRVGIAQPPTVTTSSFSEDMYKRKTILYVPEEHFDIYVNASIWNRFAVVKDTSYFNGDLMSTKYSYYACHYKQALEGDGWESPERVKWDGYILKETTAEPRDYEGFVFDHCEQAKLERLNQEIPFYYTRKEFNLTWKNGDEIISTGRYRYGKQMVPPDVEIPAPSSKHFVGWHYKSTSPIALSFDEHSTLRCDTVFYAIFTDNENQQFTVEHYKQNVTGSGYTLAETETGFGSIGSQTEAEAKTYYGFTAPANVTQQLIAADGSTVIRIEYTRNKYTVAWKNNGATHGGSACNKAFYYGSDLVKPSNPKAATGYEFVGWNTEPTATVALDLTGAKVESDVTYHAIYKQNPPKTYAVRHYQQNIDDDNYPQLPFETDIKSGIIGTQTDAAAKDYVGFIKPTVNQKKVEANMTPIDLRYERIKYVVTWMKDESTTLRTGELKYGAPLNPPANPTHEDHGKHFVGWNTDKNATTGMNVIATVTGNVTYYAIFANNGQGVYTINHYLQNINDDNYPDNPAMTTSDADLIGRTTDAKAETITGFTAPDDSDIQQQTIAESGTEVNIYYTRNSYQVKWMKDANTELPNTGGMFKFESLLQAPTNAAEAAAAAGKHFIGWNTSASATDAIDLTNRLVEADNDANIYYAIFADNESKKYHVEHYKENANNDDYTKVDTDEDSKPFGSQTTAAAKDYAGFTAQPFSQQEIKEDESTVVEIRYTRNKYPVKWMNGESEFVPTANCKYESNIVDPTTPTNKPVSADAGKHFIGWNTKETATTILDMTTQTVPLDGVIYYAIFADNDVVDYTVRHHKADLNGQFTDAEGLLSETPGSGRYGLTTNEEAETFVGFTAQTPVVQQKIKADGTTVVDIYYDRNSYTISWIANEGTLNGGTNDITQSVKYGASIAEPTHTRTGYDFKGWGLTADASSFEVIPATMPASNLSYFANWEIKEYPVRWNFNNGTSDFSTSWVAYHEPIEVAASQPKKEHWHFIGWSREQNGTPITPIVGGDYGIMGTSQVDFYAQWEIDKFELTWDANGGEIVSEGTHGQVAFGTTPLTPATVKRTGYKHEGWAIAPDATSTTTVPLAMPGHDTTFYAVWSIKQYSISWNANGGELDTEGTNGTVDYGTTITPATTKSRTGYDFIGWNTQADATTAIDVATEMPDNDLTYYAIWKVHTHTLTWNANGGFFVNENTSGNYDFGATITTPQVDRDGWKCAGWSETPNPTPNDVTTPATSMPDRDVTYYTIWITRDDNIVTWKMNDGTDFNYTSFNVTTNAVIIAPAGTPERDHYQFIGWAATPDGEVLTDLGIMNESKKTFYAKWTLNSHKIAWNANGGEIITAGTSGDNVAYGTPIKIATAERTGYSFVGWGLTADATENDAVRITNMPDNDVEYFAIWATNTYDITWMFNNGTGESFATTHVPFEGKIMAPNSNPARDHYEFAGWASTPEGDAIDDFGVLTTPGAIYYAQWQAQKFTLGWDANGGELSGNFTPAGEVEYGTPIVTPTATLANHIFAGWGTTVNRDSIVNVTTMPDSSVTYVANWITTEYAVEWRMNDGTDNNYQAYRVEFDDDITAPENDPQRAYYQFLGWAKTADGDVITDFGKMDSDHKIFYAIWQINSHMLAWNANGGELSGDYTEGLVAVGTKLIRPVATRTGYTFDGWNTYANAADSIKITTMPDNDIEYFAIWKVNRYDITWKMNNGTDSVFAKTNLNYGDTIKTPSTTPEHTDYLFGGWSATADGNAIDSLGLMPDNDLTFYAVWKAALYEAIWMVNNGTDAIFATTQASVSTTLVAPDSVPQRENYTFSGWSTTADGSPMSNIEMPKGGITLYAVWNPNQFTAIWKMNDGTDNNFETIKVEMGQPITAPTKTPTRQYYSFVGWSKTAQGTVTTDFGTMTANGAEFFAIWDAIVEFTAPESFVTCEREQKIELSGLSNKEIKFSWSVNGKVDASQTGSTFDIPEDADYSGTITVTGSFGGKDVTKSITYQRKKMMTRTLWDDVITVVNPDTAFASYRWYHNGELVDTTEYYSEAGGLTGKYYLVATTQSGVEICSCESDFGAAPEATMTVYPNPTVDDITVAGSLIETGATISVIDGNGKEWLRKTIETDGSETIRVSQMPQGMYIVKVGDKVVSFIKL